MSVAAARSPTPSLSTPHSGKRLISRITSSFTTKSRNFSDFYIHINDPHKQYGPRDTVTGSVRLRVNKPIRITHVAVNLHGFVQVFKNPGSPGEGFRANSAYLGTGRGTKRGEYFGNGFASLFEDECVLCGDGRLAEGSYQFDFEVEFPDRDLPSSIDFERGTVSYMVTATITRPTTMSPVTTVDRKIYFMERIDISSLYPPKPRQVTLEPVSKRRRAKDQARKLVDPTERRNRKCNGSHHSSDETRNSRASSAPSTQAGSLAIQSESPSEVSFASVGSSSARTSKPDGSVLSAKGSDISKITGDAREDRTITATIESLTGGCLRGDNAAVKVTVKHSKPVRSLYGVIVTLYRQARVDMHPAISLGPTEKGTVDRREDYYPKSMTGLGGLSLSGAGSSHTFRKDLAQAMVPLYIDPITLEAEVTAKVRVPDEAFPTISTVPGAMISFNYHVEVLVDLQGKLGSSDRTLSSIGMTNLHSHVLGFDGSKENGASGAFGSSIIDTSPIRRDKGVVTCVFEVVVGTRDSERRKGKQKAAVVPEPAAVDTQGQQQHEYESQAAYDASMQYSQNGDQGYWYGEPESYHDPRWYDEYYYDHDAYHNGYGQEYSYPPPAVPIPQAPDESQMSEKQRIQHAETRLLPSQPPGAESRGSMHAPPQPTAPYLPEENGNSTHGFQLLSAPSYGEASRSAAAAASPPPMSPKTVPGSSRAPQYSDAAAGSSSRPNAHPIDDKQELERQRLNAEASAPPGDDEPGVDGSDTTAAGAPSAPPEDEDHEDVHTTNDFDSHADADGHTDLPRYER